MASVFGHALTAYTLGTSFGDELRTKRLWILGILCSILPDADVVGFKLGIAYEDFWGHRGFTHSFIFALLFGILITAIFYGKKLTSKAGLFLILYFSICTASHGILDAMTSGGLGIAFFSPFDNNRYFFPWRPIQVSPIGASRFFSIWGIKVLLSELLWIGIPSGCYILAINMLKRKKSS